MVVCSAIHLLDRPWKTASYHFQMKVTLMASIPYFFVADAAFSLKPYRLRPFPGRYLPENKRIFKALPH